METDTRNAPSAHLANPAATHSGTFDPAAWLERYTALGGVYVANGELNLCILVNHQTEEDLSQIRQMIVDLSDEQRAAILAHLQAGGSAAQLDWQGVVAKYEADRDAFCAHPYGRTSPDDPGYQALSREADELTELSEASLRKMIETPAPDRAAFRFKLETAATEYGDAHGVLSHLIADVDRLSQTRSDEAILAAWERRRAAYGRYNALPFSDSSEPGDMTPEERAEWDQIDAADEVIREHVATTPEGAAVQLWIALQHSITQRDDEAACLRRDLGWFEAKGEGLDWNVRLVIAALRSLKAMEA